MLSKENRLRKKKDIEQVLKKGVSFKEGFLVLKTFKTNLDKTRFGFVVSLKVSKKATIRNSLRRKLSELVRLNLGTIKPGSDNLLISTPGMASKDFWEIKELLEKLFLRAKLLK
ncbi:MAG: ribonuclease P protein component [bacterium]|nr:ribonuclease P protein component [bacterium]